MEIEMKTDQGSDKENKENDKEIDKESEKDTTVIYSDNGYNFDKVYEVIDDVIATYYVERCIV